MKEFTVLTINPGSSSTKMGVVKGDKVIVNREVDHHKEDFQRQRTCHNLFSLHQRLCGEIHVLQVLQLLSSCRHISY